MLHGLKGADELAELDAVVPDVFRGVFPGAEGETGHLGGDADSAFVEEADGVFVALAFVAEEMVVRDLHVVEVEDTRARGFDAEFLFLFGDAEARCGFFGHEGGDSFVAFAGVEIGEDDEEGGFGAVGDPHFRPVDLISVFGLFGARAQGECVGA